MTSEHFAHTLKYVYRNPVKAGVTQLVEDYPWSSIAQPRPPMAAEMEPVETGHDEYLPQGDQLLKWLNEHYTEEQERLLSRALHRPVFGVKPDRSSGRRPYLPLP